MSNPWRCLHGDLSRVLRDLPPDSFDGCFCDPPYELGFMGKSWDRSGVAFQAETWRQVLRVLKPGAHLIAFGGSRTYHRLACAIEDAGFELRDSLIWMYGSGFPKSLNLGNGYGTALKPAYEPAILARKPLEGTVAANVQAWGCGGLWIDGCRVGAAILPQMVAGQPRISTFERGNMVTPERVGRYPANLLHDGSPEALACFPLVDASEPRSRNNGARLGFSKGADKPHQTFGHCDSGSAARFFYCAKASREERDAGCSGLRAVQRDASRNSDQPSMHGGEGNPYNRGCAPVHNNHPCVKPLALCEYLSRLILPPQDRPHGPRRLLVPFSGSGSEMIGALAAGWDHVTGVEQDADYISIAEARLSEYKTRKTSPKRYALEASSPVKYLSLLELEGK